MVTHRGYLDIFSKDTLPKDTWQKDTLPKDTWQKDTLPNGYFTDGHFADGHFAEQTFYQKDIRTETTFRKVIFCEYFFYQKNSHVVCEMLRS